MVFENIMHKKPLPFGPFSLKWLQISLGSFLKSRLEICADFLRVHCKYNLSPHSLIHSYCEQSTFTWIFVGTVPFGIKDVRLLN